MACMQGQTQEMNASPVVTVGARRRAAARRKARDKNDDAEAAEEAYSHLSPEDRVRTNDGDGRLSSFACPYARCACQAAAADSSRGKQGPTIRIIRRPNINGYVREGDLAARKGRAPVVCPCARVQLSLIHI